MGFLENKVAMTEFITSYSARSWQNRYTRTTDSKCRLLASRVPEMKKQNSMAKKIYIFEKSTQRNEEEVHTPDK